MNTAAESSDFQRPSVVRDRSVSAKRFLVIVLFLTTFVSGGVAGGLFASNKFARQMRQQTLNPGDHSSSVVQQITDELELTDAQVNLVKPLVVEHFARVKEIRFTVLPKVVDEQRKLERQVSAHLNAGQRLAWKKRCQWVREHCYPTESEQ